MLYLDLKILIIKIKDRIIQTFNCFKIIIFPPSENEILY